MKKILLIIPLLVYAGVLHAQHTFPSQSYPQGKSLTGEDSLYLMSLPELSLPMTLRNNPLPAVVDNSELPYLRPVFQQVGPSCGQACLVGYNFTYEINRTRDLPAHNLENQYATHFSYNFMNGGNNWYGVSYIHSMEVLRLCGNMNAVDYGGYIFDDGKRWITGYDVYYNAMFNRINGAYSINTATLDGLLTLKHYIYNHLEEGAPGGVASFYANSPWNTKQLNDTTPEGGKLVVTAWVPDATHAMTIVGYNDSIRWDYNLDGIYTNDLDLNIDGIIDARDWEIGGVKVVNSYGAQTHDSGFFYMMYKVLAESFENGGIWNQSVHVLDIKENYQPLMTFKVQLKHDYREKIRVRVGVSENVPGGQPQHIMDYPIFDFQGANHYMQGQDTAEYLKTIEFGLDVTPLLSYVVPGEQARFFLLIDEKDPNNEGTGELVAFSLMDYSGAPVEIHCLEAPLPLTENSTTMASITYAPSFDPPQVTTGSLPAFTAGNSYSHQLTATGGSEPYSWDLVQTYVATADTRDYDPIVANQILPDTTLDMIASVPIPFSFPFFDKDYDTIYVNACGFLQFNRDQLPWPYLEDHLMHLKKNRIIAPLTTRDFIMEPDKDDRAWVELDEDHATFRWKLSYIELTNTTNYDFSVTLYPSGKIEFNYGVVTPFGFDWISGISDGNKSNYFVSPVDELQSFNDDVLIRFIPETYPTGMELTPEGLFHGTPTTENWIYDITFRVTDNNNISSSRHLQFTNGPCISYVFHGGDDNSIEYGDTVTVDATIHNGGISPMTDPVLTLDLVDPFATIMDGQTNTATILPGGSVTLPSCFSFAVDHQTPDQHNLIIRTGLSAGQDSWQQERIEHVNAPRFKLHAWSVEDGNNHILESGENADIMMTFMNEGNADMNGVIGQVNILDPVVGLTSPNVMPLGDLSHGNAASGSFSVLAMEDILSGYSVPVEIVVNCDEQITYTDTIILKVGRKPVLVIDLDPNTHTGPVIYNILQDIGVISDYRPYIPGNLSSYQSLFVCLGFYNSNYELNWLEGGLLATYLDDGGNIYLEGRKTWRDDLHMPLHDRFNILPDGTPNWLKDLAGMDSTFAEGIQMFNGATQPFNFYQIAPIPPAFSIMHDTTNLSSCAVAYDQGNYRTVGTIFELGSLEDGEHPSTKRELLLRILDFFEVDYSLTGINEKPVVTESIAVHFFPNPTSTVSSFRFKVSPARTTDIIQSGGGSTHVILKIYDLHGREVAKVVDRAMPEGEHVVQFDASGLPTGVYVWRLSVVGSRLPAAGKLIKF